MAADHASIPLSELRPHGGPIWQANLRALAIRQPELAAHLRTLAPPPAARVVAGRDGLPTALLTESAEQLVWLGGSSMPSVSAPPALASFVDRGANTALASVGTGFEPVYLAGRIAPHLAVFVCERDIAAAALALSVADWSAELAAGRLVLWAGDVAAECGKFFAAHPGYVFPRQLFVPTGLDQIVAAGYSSALAQAAVLTDATYERTLRDVAQALSERRAGELPIAPRLLVQSGDHRADAAEVAGALQRAAAAVGWQVETCIADSPQRAGLLAPLLQIREFRPDVVLTLNGSNARVQAYMPIGLRQMCWYLDAAPVAKQGVEPSGAGSVLAATPSSHEALAAAGVEVEHVEVIAEGGDDIAYSPPAASSSEERHDVLLLADVCDDSAAAAGVMLETHAKLWQELSAALLQRAREGGPLAVDAILGAAEKKSGVALSDAEARARFVELAESRLVRSCAARAVAAALPNANLRIHGHGWPADARAAPWPRSVEARAAVLRTCAWVILPVADAAALRQALSALLCGACPLIRRPASASFSACGVLEEVFTRIPTFGRADDLPRMLKDRAAGASRAAELAEIIRARHTWKHRLAQIHGILASRDG